MMRLIAVLALFAPCSYAAEVLKIKGDKALIKTDGDEMSPGQTFAAMQGGKKKAIIRIGKVKGNKALGKVIKGTAGPGMSLQAEDAGSSPSPSRGSRRRQSGGEGSGGRSYWGAMFGFAMDSMTVKVNDSNTNTFLSTEALTGSGFSGLLMFDYEIFPQVWFRGMGGVEQFSVAGNSKCGNGNKEACNATITYMAGNLIARYVFSNGSLRPWIGAGVELLFPAAKSSTALNSSSIGTTNALVPQLGIDLFVSPTLYIPVSVEYGLLPDSSEVKANWIAVRAGFALPF